MSTTRAHAYFFVSTCVCVHMCLCLNSYLSCHQQVEKMRAWVMHASSHLAEEWDDWNAATSAAATAVDHGGGRSRRKTDKPASASLERHAGAPEQDYKERRDQSAYDYSSRRRNESTES